MKEEHYIWEIIQDRINNTISGDDLKIFKDWLESSPENRLLFENIQSLKNSQSHFEKYDNIDLELAWKKIEKSTKEKSKLHPFAINFLKYAAVFFIGIFSLYLWNIKNNAITSTSFNTVAAPNGSKTKIELADGTEVTLNGGSKLIYPEFFSKDKRTVELIGEAYFDVQRDEKRPFFINTTDMDIKVLGTSFNVRAYPEDETVETFVTSGKVELILAEKYKQEKKVYLNPNEKAVFFKEISHVEKGELEDKSEQTSIQRNNNQNNLKPKLMITAQASIKEEISWRDEKFIFKNEPLEDLVKKLERWYGVEIVINKEGLKQYHFTGTFEKETIEQVMKAMAYSIPIEWEMKEKKITISAKSN